jgi:thiol:disulfide interchange protein DsbD
MAFAAIVPLEVKAQIVNPVKWSIAIKDLNETEFDVVATATIDPEYHIYSTTMPDLGPLPTVFDIKTSEFF